MAGSWTSICYGADTNCLAGAGRPDFPPIAVLRVAAGATMRHACTVAGIDPDVLP
jgi:hypothetical protein